MSSNTGSGYLNAEYSYYSVNNVGQLAIANIESLTKPYEGRMRLLRFELLSKRLSLSLLVVHNFRASWQREYSCDIRTCKKLFVSSLLHADDLAGFAVSSVVDNL